ncbi:hypothetical protein YQE_05350, partial [Dendroctonus ponderosae]
MAFVSLIFSAQKLKKLQQALEEEKLDAIKANEDKTFKKKFKFRHIGFDIKEALKNGFRRAFKCSEGSPGYQTCYKLGHEGSCENFVLKSALGFVGGIFLTYFLCIVLLTLPQFFSKRGRQALLAYAFVLALTGPAQNTLNNLGILSESLACGQEQLKQAVKQIIDVIKKPFMTIKEAIKKVVKTVKEVVKKIKEILLKIKRIVMAIVRVIKSVFEFLGKILNICNKELGTPFERCSRVFENAIADCNAKLGPLFNWLCSLAYIVKAVCYIVKVFDYVCMIVDFISNSVVGVIIRKIKIFVRHIKTMFYVRIKFAHSFEYKTISSKSLKDIAKEIVAEIKDRSRGIVAFFNFMTSASMLFLMYLVFQVAYYRFKYLTSERYDNIYINQYFREIDQRRAKSGKETVLPLTKKEKLTYVPINSGALAKTERRSLSKNATKLATASVKLGTHMAADYILHHFNPPPPNLCLKIDDSPAPNLPVAHITGEGFIAKLLRSIVNAFQPVGIKLEIDTVPCLPIPIPPDFDRYVQIGITIAICWILTILEPYGLRFRNYIMGYYHPLRAKQRTIWLYNHLLRSRTSFLLLTRRKLRKRFGMKGGSGETSCKDLLRSKLNRCGIFKICLGSDLQLACLLCGDVFHEAEKEKFVKCSTPQCPGLFCVECFADLSNICPICLSPLEYGDIDDADEEKDSSGDEPPADKPKKKPRCPWLPCGAPKSQDESEDDEKPLITKDGDVKSEAAEEGDSSSDYSYSYQYDSDLDSKQPLPKPTVWKDLEMQAGLEEASMQTFLEEEELLCIDLDNRVHVPKKHAALVRMDIRAEPDPEPEETETIELEIDNLLQVPKKSTAQVQLDVTAAADAGSCRCSASSSTRHVEFIGLPQEVKEFHKKVRRLKDFPCICSDLEDVEELPKSTMSTSTRSDCQFCRCPAIEIRSTLTAGSETEEDLKNIVPRLDLSFLKERDDVCSCEDNHILSSRFSYVTYEEICETPRASPSTRSLESSTLISSLQHSLGSDADASPALRRRKRHQQENYPEVDSSSSMDSLEFNRAQTRRVRQYYEATRQIEPGSRPQCSKGKTSIIDMFRKLLPKRKTAQNYLPLHRREVDDEVQIQSYNYNRRNWDTISIDTNSPTYPFGSQGSSDTSDEEEKLLGPKRIRGGECVHLINCKLIGRECRVKKRVRSFDAKSRTRLKDFSTLSLPPKPKPANAKELISRYFPHNALEERTTEKRGCSMKSTDNSKINQSSPSTTFADREDSSDYILPKPGRLTEDATPPSSDSGLSESTCLELFGSSCPQGIGKASSGAIKVPPEPPQDFEGGDSEESLKAASSTSSRGSQITQQTLEAASNQAFAGLLEENQLPEAAEEQGLENQLETKSAETRREANQRKASKQSIEFKTRLLPGKEASSTKSLTEPYKQSIASKTHQLPQKQASFTSSLTATKEESKQSLELAEQLTHSIRKCAQQNHLLYKDERTEISLVQKLRPSKGAVQTHPTFESPRPAPSVKLQISLHNTIIPEEEPEADQPSAEPPVVRMSSPKSQDKIVETRDSFPLHEWLPSGGNRSGKLILPSDKTQQTSDNDIYQSSNATAYNRASSKASAPLDQSSGFSAYYSSEVPERDATCNTNCKCSICKIAQRHQGIAANVRVDYGKIEEERGCGCCKCNNERLLLPSLPPVRRSDRNYEVPGFMPRSADADLPEFLPPPPPRPQPPRRTFPHSNYPAYRRSCGENCDCYLRHFAGDYSQPSSYPFRPQPAAYGFEPGYREDDQFAYSNPDPNLSDLPYQNNEEYLELVQELQDTLHSRNRNRVKRAMQEFEDRSKQNKPLDKPIINYDETSESEEPIIRKIDQMRIGRKMSGAEQQPKRPKPPAYPRREPDKFAPEERPSHWTMDPGSGEWLKGVKNGKPKGRRMAQGEFECNCSCNCEHRYQ